MPRSAPLLLSLLLLAPASRASAQGLLSRAQDTASTRAADTLPAPPAAVPLADIPSQSEVVEARLDEIRQILAQNRELVALGKAFEATQDTIARLLARQEQPGPERPTKRALTDLQSEWARRGAQVAAWRKQVGDRTAALGGVQAELRRREESWKLTLAGERKEGPPGEVVDLVGGTIQAITTTEGAVKAQLDSLLHLQSRIAQTAGVIQRAHEQVASQLASERRSMLRLDAPPLWKAMGALTSGPGLVAAVRQGVARTASVVAYFVEVYRTGIYIHLASTLVILLGVFWFRGQLEPHTAEQPAASARRVLDNPLAGAVLIIALAALFLYPRAPLSIYDLALLATVPPLLVLLPGILPEALRRPAVVCAVLFAVQRLGGLLVGESPWQRPGLFLVALACTAGGARLLRSGGRLARLGETAYARALRVAVRVAVVVFAAATLANIAGNLTFATFATTGMLASAYLLLVVLTAVHVADGLLIVLARSRTASVSRVVAQRREWLVQGGVRLIRFGGAVGWIALTLWLFDLLGPLAAMGQRALGASLTVGELSLSLGAALLFLGTVWVSVLVGRALSAVLEMDVLSRLDLPRGLPSVIGRLTRYALIALGFFFALAALGVELTQLTIIGGALGVGIGFGLQNVVSNFVSGLILAFERPIREGDTIQVDTVQGEVRRIGFRASVIRTWEGAEVIVPNASLIAKDVVNWTLSDLQRRISLPVGVAYGTEPARVTALLLDAARATPGVLAHPEPLALFTGFGESALTFELRFWCSDPDRVSILRSEVATAANTALTAAGIEIPFPQRDLHLRTVDPAAAERLGRPAT